MARIVRVLVRDADGLVGWNLDPEGRRELIDDALPISHTGDYHLLHEAAEDFLEVAEGLGGDELLQPCRGMKSKRRRRRTRTRTRTRRRIRRKGDASNLSFFLDLALFQLLGHLYPATCSWQGVSCASGA